MAVDGYLNFDTKIDTGGFRHGVQSLSGGLDGLKSKLRSVAAAAAAAFSIRAIISFTKAAKDAYAVQLEAEARLTQVMRHSMQATEGQIAAVKAYASELQQLGVIGDEVQLSGLQELATYVADPASLRTMNTVLNDMLAQQYGLNASAESAVTIATMLGKVLDGQTGALSRYGYRFTEAQEQMLKYGTEAQRVATLAEVVEASVGGMNEALAKTPAGRMKQLSNTLGDVKETFGQAAVNLEVLLLPALTHLTDRLSQAAQFALSLSEGLADVFGITLDSSTSAAEAVGLCTDAQNALTEAAEETATAQEKILTGYDEIHRLAGGTEVLPSVGGIVPAAVAVQPDLRSADKAAKRISERIGELTLPIKLAWSARGAETVGRVSEMMQELRGLTDSVGISWEKVWKNGTGQRSAELLLGIVGGISGTVGGLAGSFRRAWDENDRGTRIVQGIWNGFNNVLETGDRFWKSTSDWTHRLDFGPLLDSCGELSETFADLADPDSGLGNDLLWLYENVLQPLGKWTLEKALPTTISATADALDGMRKIWIKVREPLRKLYEQFLKPVAELTGDAALSLISGLGKGLQSIGDSMTDKQAEVLVKAAAGITAIVAAVKGIGKGAALFASAKAFFGGAGGLGALLGSELGAVGLPKTLMASAAALIGGYTLGDIIFNDLLGLDKFTTRFGEWLYDFTHGTDTSEWSQFWQDFGADAAGLIDSGWKDIESWWDKLFTEDEATDKELALLRVQGGVEGLSRSLDDTSEEASSFSENWISGFKDIEDTTKTAWENTKESLSGGWGKLKGFFTGYRSNWKTGWDEIKQKASGTWDSVKTKLSTGWESVKSGFSDFKSNWETGWSTVKSYCSEKWDRIKEKITNSAAWETVSGSFNGFRENWISGLDTISRKTANFRDTVKRIFEHIWSGQDGKGGMKSVINSILSGLETMLNGAVSGLNKAISGINSISLDTPDWIPLIGGKHIGFSIPELSRASLPRLATGTVVPANYGEFAAILGDNRHEAEIVSPISAMKQAFLEALAESSAGQSSTAPVTEIIRLVLDGKTIAETVRKHQLGRGRITNGGMA